MSLTRAERPHARRLVGVATNLAVAALVLLAVALLVVPRVLGGTSLSVLSGSMEPTFSAGDVIAVRAVDPEAVEVGDVIVFQMHSGDPTLVTHRVVDKTLTADGPVFVTQGDANDTADLPIVAEQIKGQVMFHVPWLGHARQALNPVPLPELAGAGLLAFGLWRLAPRRRPAVSEPAAPAHRTDGAGCGATAPEPTRELEEALR